MKHRLTLLVTATLTALVWGTTASGEGPKVAAAYAGVEIVSIDPSTRLIVIKNSEGVEETYELDANVAGALDVKAGDRAIVTVRGEPGRKRVSAISKATQGPSAPTARANASPAPRLANEEPGRSDSDMRERFASQVAALSQQARSIDAKWSSFVTSCDAKPTSGKGGGREWFGLWDGRVKADLSSGFCRDLFNQIVSSGEGIKKAMAAAEEVARKTLDAGDLREIRTLNSMDWEGWALPAPAKLEL
jgi:hypothetical protein